MASSTATKKKASTAKKPAAKNTKTTKKTTVKAAETKKRTLPVGVYCENYPEKHVATGKYKFFFVFFGCTTVIFAALAVWLFIFSSEVLNKWEELDADIRNGKTCQVVRAEDKAEAKDPALDVTPQEDAE